MKRLMLILLLWACDQPCVGREVVELKKADAIGSSGGDLYFDIEYDEFLARDPGPVLRTSSDGQTAIAVPVGTQTNADSLYYNKLAFLNYAQISFDKALFDWDCE